MDSTCNTDYSRQHNGNDGTHGHHMGVYGLYSLYVGRPVLPFTDYPREIKNGETDLE